MLVGALFHFWVVPGLLSDLEEVEERGNVEGWNRRPRSSIGCSVSAFSSSASACSLRRSSGARSGVDGAWRAYLWPSIAFLMGVLMWPVMVFYTSSAIHMTSAQRVGAGVDARRRRPARARGGGSCDALYGS